VHALKLNKVVIGITGCIAAYKTAQLVRLLVQAGVEVRVVMTPSAQQFIGATTFQALSGHPIYLDPWDSRIPNQMPHIELSRWADLILIAPCTAETLAKLAHGQADNLLTTLCLARDIPLWVAPAMNRQMWNHPATQRNIKQLETDGVRILGPATGLQACGEEGDGRMLEADDLFSACRGFGLAPVFLGKKIIITAGPTFEALDTVRGLTNQSSGKMGFAVAEAAVQAGAKEVILVSGPVSRHTPLGVQRINVQSAQEMHDTVHQYLSHTDFFFGVAAVSDYRAKNVLAHKLKRETQSSMHTEWIANPDILASVAQHIDAPFCIGFAAESESMLEHAQHKRQRKGVPLLAANQVQEAIAQDENTLTLLDDNGIHLLPRAPKWKLAQQLILHTAHLYSLLHTQEL
jgi:phosphopantothenoylcysteine decarboxylase / phosphopantothenate---cysteine ligase